VSDDTSVRNNCTSCRKHSVVALTLHGKVKHMRCESSMED
jgi:hypothetical protein